MTPKSRQNKKLEEQIMDRSASAAFRTEASFELPLGYVDESGVRHRRGVMRLATAADEILPMRDPRVQANPAYLSIIILSRVVMKLGSLPDVDTQVVERLFTQDFEYLRRLYEELNGADEADSPADPLTASRANGHAAGGPLMLGEA
jgi:hypothetical protein